MKKKIFILKLLYYIFQQHTQKVNTTLHMLTTYTNYYFACTHNSPGQLYVFLLAFWKLKLILAGLYNTCYVKHKPAVLYIIFLYVPIPIYIIVSGYICNIYFNIVCLTVIENKLILSTLNPKRVWRLRNQVLWPDNFPLTKYRNI